MRFLCTFALLAAWPLCAATIDLSLRRTADLKTGDALAFTIAFSNYHAGAAGYGAPAIPEVVSFTLISAPFSGVANFSATLESYDRSYASSFTAPVIGSAIVGSSLYSGPASAISASDRISAEDAEIFAGPAAILVLRNTGPDITLGLPPYALKDILKVTVSGGPLSVGGVMAGIALESGSELMPILGENAPEGQLMAGPSASVPEPGTVFLFAGGSLLLGATMLRRAKRGRIQ